MKNRISHYFAILATLSICLTTSCTRENDPEENQTSNIALSFSVYQSDNVTKTVCEDVKAEISPLDMTVENAGEVAMATNFRLQVSEQPLEDEQLADSAPITRGTPVYTENLGNFAVKAFLPKTSAGNYSDTYLPEAVFEKDGTVWSHTYTEHIRWPENDGPVVFFMRYPASSASESWTYARKGSNNIISIASYSSPGAGSGTTAAEQQTDLVFATTRLTEADRNTTNKVLFYHPFAGVKFKLGDLPEGLVVKSITLGNVLGSGSCEITPYFGNTDKYTDSDSNRDGEAGTRSKDCTVWNTTSSTRVSFTQGFAAADHKTTPDGGLFPAGFKDQGSSKPNHDQLNTSSLSKTFILIPQTFTASNKLSIAIAFEYNGTTLSRTAQLDNVTWNAGSLYTYTVKFNSDIDVTITDEVNGAVKKNVAITNTGNVPEYIRAAIVGNWFNAGGEIVSAWSMSQGSFSGLPGNGWVKDGAWYYYTAPVAPGAETPGRLFTTYTAPAAPVTGAHLEMKIMVQAIIADGTVANQTWGLDPSNL